MPKKNERPETRGRKKIIGTEKVILLIAEVIELVNGDKNHAVTSFEMLGGTSIKTVKEALEIANHVLGGYDGGPKLAEPITMFLVKDGYKIPLTVKRTVQIGRNDENK